MIRHLCLEIPNKIGYRHVRLKQKDAGAGFFFKLRYFHFSLAENMIYAYWWLPNILGGAAGWDIRADKKMTCHLRHTYLFLLILMVWPLQSLHENMQMAGLVQTKGLPLPVLCLQRQLWAWQPKLRASVYDTSPHCICNAVWQGTPYEFSIAWRIFILRSLTPADSI